jgi:SAM-dependent methyltransferase
MVQPSAAQAPLFISGDHLDHILALLKAVPSVAILDLGILATPTSHPAFASFAREAGSVLQERGGFVVVWSDATTDRSLLAKVAEYIGPVVAMPLPLAETLNVNELAQIDNVILGDANGGDPFGLGVPLAARPDACAPLSSTSIRGGCPIVEQRSLFFDADGRAFACQRQLLMDEPIAGPLQTGPATRDIDHAWKELRHALRLDQRDRAMRSCADCGFSYQGWVDDAQLRAFWLAQDDRGDIVDVAERKYLFDRAIPTQQRILKVDLGCGPVKRPGFLGIDRFPLPGVDIVADINEGIPLPDDSVDYLVASHSLEHFDDLPHIVHEIHRVCKDRALVTIVAPYSATGLNLANPYHVQVFNEHTARFFTNAAETALQRSDYDFPSAVNWGLASSDHSSWHADLRLLKCEFFYMPAYRGLDEAAKRVLRQSLNDVCEQILLQLLVVKSPITEEEFSERVRSTVYQEPPAVTARRAQEAVAGERNLFTELVGLPLIVRGLDVPLIGKRITAVNTELIRRDHEHLQRAEEVERRLAALQSQVEGRGKAAHVPSLSTIPELMQSRQVRVAISREHDGDLFTRRVRLYRRRAQDLTSSIAPNFVTLTDFGRRHGWGAGGARLQESELWCSGQEWIYDLPVDGRPIVGLRLALAAQFEPFEPTAVLNCRMWSADGSVVLADSDIRVNGGLSQGPIEFRFNQVEVSCGLVHIRLVGLPAVELLGIRTIEWRKLSIFRQVKCMRLCCEPIYM